MSINNRSIQQGVLIVAMLFAGVTAAFAHGDQVHVMGTVVKVDASSIQVKTAEGDTKTVMILPTTKFVKGTTAMTAQDVKPGDRVVIHAKPEGNMLRATEVKIGVAQDSMHHN